MINKIEKRFDKLFDKLEKFRENIEHNISDKDLMDFDDIVWWYSLLKEEYNKLKQKKVNKR